MIMRIEIKSKENLAEILRLMGVSPDLRCGGRGICGRCKVKLLSGKWLSDKKIITAPADVPACRTSLLSDTGEIEFINRLSDGVIPVSFHCENFTMPGNGSVIGIDIGTTTLAAVKMCGGKITASAGAFNPQISYGDNVMSRIAASAQGHLSELQRLLHEAVDGLLEKLSVDGVERAVLSGNTVMMSIFHGIDPVTIGSYPFTAPVLCFPAIKRKAMDILTLPCASGFIGGDFVAGIKEVALQPGDLLIDIGTNCEMALNTGSEIICTSAAAGPAFEGAGLTCGMRGAGQAVMRMNDDFSFSTVSGVEAEGICGSGYVDFLAVCRRKKIIDEFGRFCDGRAKYEFSEKCFVTESDIEQLLKAKAAIYAGIVSLEKFCNTPVRRIFCAGGFAEFTDLKNAVAIGMLPDRECRAVGNTSLAGALRVAAQPELMTGYIETAQGIREVFLNDLAGFEENFIDALLLP